MERTIFLEAAENKIRKFPAVKGAKGVNSSDA